MRRVVCHERAHVINTLLDALIILCQFVGAENLDLMENAVRYTAYVGQLVASELPTTGNILEFGAGSGSQTAHVLKPTERLTCIEINPELQETLTRRGYKVASGLSSLTSQVPSLRPFRTFRTSTRLTSLRVPL